MKRVATIEQLVYEAPKASGFGHSVRNKNHYETALAIDSFLKTYTDIDRNITADFSLYHDKSMNVEMRQKFIRDFSDAFGKPKPPTQYDIYIINPTVIWEVGNLDLVDLVNFLMKEYETKNKVLAAKFWLTKAYSFHWKTLYSHGNLFGICLGNRMCTQPEFYFPNTIENENTTGLIKEVFSAMPFPVNIKYFKTVTIDDKGSRIRARKLTEQAQALLNAALLG